MCDRLTLSVSSLLGKRSGLSDLIYPDWLAFSINVASTWGELSRNEPLKKAAHRLSFTQTRISCKNAGKQWVPSLGARCAIFITITHEL